MVVVYWASEVCKSFPKGDDEKEGGTFMERIGKWKEDVDWARHAAVLTKRAERGRAWFKPEYVESLADLFEEALKGANIKDGEIGFETEEEFFQMKNMVLRVCGYCQGQGLYGSKWPWKISCNGGDEDHYERSGRAWKRIVDCFICNLWETSQKNVTKWYWHDAMMQRVLRERNRNRIQHVDLLRSRWAARSNHPLAPTRRALEEVSEATINGLERDEEDQGYLDDGVWIE